MILDEPFTGLDPINVGMMKDAVRTLQKNGCAIIFSSHQMEYIEDFCEHLVILVKGHAVVNGKLEDIKKDYAKQNIIIKGEDIVVKELEQIEGVLSVVKKHNEYEVVVADEKVTPLVFNYVKNKKITKYVLKDASLNEIFIHYVGGQYE